MTTASRAVLAQSLAAAEREYARLVAQQRPSAIALQLAERACMNARSALAAYDFAHTETPTR